MTGGFEIVWSVAMAADAVDRLVVRPDLVTRDVLVSQVLGVARDREFVLLGYSSGGWMANSVAGSSPSTVSDHGH